MRVSRSETALVIPAAGSGVRMSHGKPKPLIELRDKPILIWTLEPFVELGLTDQMVVVVSKNLVSRIERTVEEHFGSDMGLRVIPGGADRQGSVLNGLLVLKPETEIVVIHDAARPFVEPRAILESIDAAREYGAATVAIPVVDTILAVNRDGTAGETLDRSRLWAVQTPQTFQYDTILQAHEDAEKEGVHATDDAELVRRRGSTVKVVEGSPENIKITRPPDLELAEYILQRRGV